MIRILNCESEGYSLEAETLIRGKYDYTGKDISRDELLPVVHKYDVLIVRLRNQIDREIIDKASNLKAIVSATTGLDHIDIDYAQAKQIKVLSLKGEEAFLRTVPATAELTWGLLLALSRRIPAAIDSVRQGHWCRDEFRGHDLSGKRLGVLGVGRIGRMVASYGLAFGMTVYGFDTKNKAFPKGVLRAGTLYELLSQSDVLTIHVPLEAATIKLIGAKELDHLPDNAIVVNTSRGDILDLKALLGCLGSGRIAGAAVDVLPGERENISDKTPGWRKYMLEHDNLLVTPHMGGASFESMAMTEVFMAKKLLKWLDIRGFLAQQAGEEKAGKKVLCRKPTQGS